MPNRKSAALAQRPMRADARRNYERLVAEASAVVGEAGADASLEEIARRAGVGSATLHRHFPSRGALLEAVFRDRVQTLCARADALAAEREPSVALVEWLRAMVAHASANRGLGTSLAGVYDSEMGASCHAMITAAGKRLLVRAQRSGSVSSEVKIGDVLHLVNAISLATEHLRERVAQADRLLSLVVTGLLLPNQPRG
jgi:AcrR family transcriptional regulator